MCKQKENDIKEKNDKLINTERLKAKIDIISRLCYELNNPLQILSCMAEIDNNKEYKIQLDRIVSVLNQLREEQSLGSISMGEDVCGSVPKEKQLVKSNSNSILVVDDEIILREMFIEVLTDAFPGLVIDSAGDGKKALDLFIQKHYSLIVMDISLPIMSGEDTFIEIKRICKIKQWDLPSFIFCTGFIINENLKEFIGDESLHTCLRKPITITSLVETVKRYLS